MDANSVIIVREASGYGPVVVGALITAFSILLAAIVAYKFGLRTYFRKREHELILKRYLAEGIDLISKRVTDAEQAFFYNYNKAYEIVEQLSDFKKIDTTGKFLTIQAYLGLMPLHKLRYLLGDDILATSIQELLVFVNSKGAYLNEYFYQQALKIERTLQDHQNLETLERLTVDLTMVLKRQIDEAYAIWVKYTFVQTKLHHIASILEKETTLTWADLSNFRDRKEIKQIVEIVRKKSAEVKEERRSKLEQKQ